jgi:hydrogenase expression/formation protein HypC
MCLGIPGRLVERFDKHGAHFGRIDVDGTVKEVCLELLPELEVGQYAIVHLGFAISHLDEDEAMETLELMSSLGALEEGLDPAQLAGDAAVSGGDGLGS